MITALWVFIIISAIALYIEKVIAILAKAVEYDELSQTRQGESSQPDRKN